MRNNFVQHTLYEVIRDGCTVSLTNVIAIGVDDRPGGLAKAMEILHESNISIEYMYAFLSKSDAAAFVILRVEDNESALKSLDKNGIRILKSSEVYEV